MCRSTAIVVALVVAACAAPEETPADVDAPDAGAAPTVRLVGDERITFTHGAHTVLFRGPTRTLSETAHGVTAAVVTDTWVHLLPRPYDGTVDPDWVTARLADDAAGAPDVLAIAMQYIDAAPPLLDDDGLQIAGDAAWGTAIGSDFNDYLGVAWPYPGGVEPPDPASFRSLDCSGYVRMVFGYRGGLPLANRGASLPGALPRSADQLLAEGPGVVIVPDSGVPVATLDALRPGDLVFFDSSDDERDIDHVGLYLGVDTEGHPRMISSRTSMRGPTMRDGSGLDGETRSKSILDGDGLYARTIRGARRF